VNFAQYYQYDEFGSASIVGEEVYKAHRKKLREEKEARKEEAIQETISFEDETTVAGKKYPLLVMPSGLFVYKNEVPPEESKSQPNPEHKLVLFVPSKSKNAKQKFKKIKMHPMTSIVIRSKTADKDKDHA
jgi:hypothetical protein